EVPKGLPPKRAHDHTIPLIPNTPPISIRPYIHPHNQKDEVELMVKELLDSGVIRNSQIPFSSPIVMVKKKYGTWRICADYKQLNKQTVKDKFPIPVIEELIDELNGAKTKTYVEEKFTWVDGILRRKDKIVVGNVVRLRNNIINHYHFDATGGHSGTTVTVHRLKSLFY
ncbi:hypothetical protein Tco_1469684, partial [Tanacetum coccineum]